MNDEKRETLKGLIEIAEKRVRRLEALQTIKAISKAQLYELDMHRDFINKAKLELGLC